MLGGESRAICPKSGSLAQANGKSGPRFSLQLNTCHRGESTSRTEGGQQQQQTFCGFPLPVGSGDIVLSQSAKAFPFWYQFLTASGAFLYD